VSEESSAVGNPWISAWRRPRATIQHIIDTDPEKQVVALAALSGIVQTFLNAISRSLGDQVALPVLLGLILIVGPILGVIGLYLWAVLLRWTGRWIGGNARTLNLRAAVAWGSAPMILGGIFLVPALLIGGHELFTELTPRLEQRPLRLIAVGLLVVLQAVTAIWSAIAMLKMIGQVQGFSAWRALGNSLLAALVVFVPLFLIIVVVAALAR
jgi:hypothetical protein